MDANHIQIGGQHYRKKYQHWDLVCDTKMPYLLACATKYLSRWREKNGVEDLRKAVHYITKADELGIHMPSNKWWEEFIFWKLTTEHKAKTLTCKFTDQLPYVDGYIIRLIIENNYDEANKHIIDLIEDFSFGADASYINQDRTYFKG